MSITLHHDCTVSVSLGVVVDGGGNPRFVRSQSSVVTRQRGDVVSVTGPLDDGADDGSEA